MKANLGSILIALIASTSARSARGTPDHAANDYIHSNDFEEHAFKYPISRCD